MAPKSKPALPKLPTRQIKEVPKVVPIIAKTKDNFLPGQKYAMPLKTDALYLFYTSCLRQKKGKSPMAEKWCLEHGVFKADKAARLDMRNQLEKLALKKK